MTKPNLPLELNHLPPPPSERVLAFLPILGKPVQNPPEVFFDHEPPDAPRTPPRASGFVTAVEWAFGPGNSRIEAYHIGTNQQRNTWVLWQFTLNDLMPFVPKYSEKKPIARLARQGLPKREAAVFLLQAVWEFERDAWHTPEFLMVSDCGCLDSTATYAIAETVWSDAEKDH